MQGEGGEGCLGTKLTSFLQKLDCMQIVKEGKCDLGLIVSALVFSHDNSDTTPAKPWQVAASRHSSRLPEELC